MAKRTMRSKRTVGRRRRGLRRRGGMRKRSTNAVTGGPNTCRITETFDLPDVQINTPYEYVLNGISPNTRAAQVAPNFGLYRIAKAIITYKPHYDTYTPGIVNSIPGNNYITTVPQLYWKMIRYGDAPAVFDDDYLKEMGARANRFDDKPVTVAYRPNILLADAGAAAQGLNGGSGQLKMTPWLSTDSEPGNGAFALSTTVHYGHILYVAANLVNNTSKPFVGSAELKIIYEFKNPRGLENQVVDLPQKITVTPGGH